MQVREHSALVSRLSRASVKKHFDAYDDIEWDHPENAIDPEDPRFERDETDPLGATEWYRSLPQPKRARLGLHMVVHNMRIGIAFENVLSRGLLELASELPIQSSDVRYAYHEVIEESQHQLMFREFVVRSGMDAPGLTGFDAFSARLVPGLGRTFPELFFLFVLGGEEPIDKVQKRELQRKDVHPLLRRIMRIHVTEEARHLSFAHSYLRENVPKLGIFRKAELMLRIPITLSVMAKQMLQPSRMIVRQHGIPRSVMRGAYASNPAHRATVRDDIGGIRELCLELSLIPREIEPLWRYLGLI
jgi:hypothetical protein